LRLKGKLLSVLMPCHAGLHKLYLRIMQSLCFEKTLRDGSDLHLAYPIIDLERLSKRAVQFLQLLLAFTRHE
jgi:hypothetical protein